MRSFSPAPKYCAVITPAPVEKPTAAAKNSVIILAVVPTAASASSLAKFPTTMVSTVLYNCCKSSPIKTGIEKDNTFFHGVPVIMELSIPSTSYKNNFCLFQIPSKLIKTFQPLLPGIFRTMGAHHAGNRKNTIIYGSPPPCYAFVLGNSRLIHIRSSGA